MKATVNAAMSEWIYCDDFDWKEDASGDGTERLDQDGALLPDELNFCTLLSGSSESSFAFSPANSDHVLNSLSVGEANNSSCQVQTEKPQLVFTLSVDPKRNDKVDESVNVKVTIDLQQDATTHTDMLSHSLPADALVWSPALRPLDRLLATNIEMARLQQELDDVEESGESEERVKRPRNAFMFFCSNQRPELQKLYPGLNNRTISQMLGSMWRSLSSDEKKPYQGEAAREREHHKKQHPDWKYSVDKAKGVKRRMKAVRKLQRVFETEVKGKGRRKMSSRDFLSRESPANCNPDSSLWYLDAHDTPGVSSDTHEPAACWVMTADDDGHTEKETQTVTLTAALDLLDDSHGNVGSLSLNSSVCNEKCDDQTAPVMATIDDISQIAHEHNLSMFASVDQQPTGGSVSDVSQMLSVEVPVSPFRCAFQPMPKRNKKRTVNPYSFGCRRFYGMTCFNLWCSGCRQKKRCCRNDQFSVLSQPHVAQ